MVTLSVCLETVYPQLPVDERIARIAEAGFPSVEFWHPEGTWDGRSVRTDWAKDAVAVRAPAIATGNAQRFALHAWDGSIGGSPVKPQDRGRFLAQVRQMMAFAQEAGCRQGIVLSGTVDESLSRQQMRKNLEDALAEAVAIADQADFTLLLEPLNTLVDHPGYYLDSSREAVEIVRTLGSPRLRVLYDVYHMQIMEGNVLATIEKNLPWIGHFHAAGVPGRGEVFDSELHYPTILAKIKSLGYDGSFGLEYFPRLGDHGQSLRRSIEHLSPSIP